MRSSFPPICTSFLFVITMATTGCEDKVANTEQGVRNVVVEKTEHTPLIWPTRLPLQTPLPSPVNRATDVKPDKSVYRADQDLQGAYVVESVKNDDERELLISFSDDSIEPPHNDPDAATIPGFYPSNEIRLDFEEIEVVGRKVYFKTRKNDGVSFKFRGTAGRRIVPDFSSTDRIPFIKGTLEEIVNGRITKSEKVTFGHKFIM